MFLRYRYQSVFEELLKIYQAYKENLEYAKTGRCLKYSECVYVYVMFVMLTVAIIMNLFLFQSKSENLILSENNT